MVGYRIGAQTATVILTVVLGCYIAHSEACGNTASWQYVKDPFYPNNETISVSMGLGGVWGAGKTRVYYRHGTADKPGNIGHNGWKDWNDVTFRMVESGNYSVWAIDTQYQLVCRFGVEPGTPLGFRWEDGPNRLMRHVSISPKGFLVGVTKDRKFAYRQGLSNSCTNDWEWTVEDGEGSMNFKMVAAGSSGVWAIGDSNGLYHRYDTRWDGNTGESWTKVDNDEYKYVSVGSNVVMAIKLNNQVWRREGVNWEQPTGSSWLRMQGKLLKIVDMHHDVCAAWGVNTHGEVYQLTY